MEWRSNAMHRNFLLFSTYGGNGYRNRLSSRLLLLILAETSGHGHHWLKQS
jgi:hypothetical protein